jgi:hypothetical protein
LHPYRCQPFFDSQNFLRYRVTDRLGHVRVYDPSDILHVPSMGFDGLRSPSPITYAAREAIGMSLAAEEFSARFFSQGSTHDIALKTDKKLDEVQIDLLRQTYVAKYGGGKNSRVPLILSGGLKVEKLSITPQDAAAHRVAPVHRRGNLPRARRAALHGRHDGQDDELGLGRRQHGHQLREIHAAPAPHADRAGVQPQAVAEPRALLRRVRHRGARARRLQDPKRGLSRRARWRRHAGLHDAGRGPAPRKPSAHRRRRQALHRRSNAPDPTSPAAGDNRGINAKARGARITASANGSEATLYLYDVIVGSQLEAEWFGGVTARRTWCRRSTS